MVRWNEIATILNGNPVFYHGTNKQPFAKFDRKFTGGIGFHFSHDPNRAAVFGKNLIKARLQINNPAGGEKWKEALDKARGGNPRKMAVEYLKAQGYDSVVTSYETIVFDAEQIEIINENAVTHDPIDSMIKNSKYTPQNISDATCGLCGTFALALHHTLTKRNIQSSLVLFHGGRDPWTSWSHVGVRVGDSYYDIRGKVNVRDVHREFDTSDVSDIQDEHRLLADLKELSKTWQPHWDKRRYNMYIRRCDSLIQ